MREELFLRLNNETVVLTPNRRLALALSREFDNSQLKLGNSSWPTLRAFSLPSWLRSLQPQEKALTETQQLYLWQEIISNSELTPKLLNITATAIQAQKAWQLLWEWQLDLNSPLFTLTDDTAIFQSWAREYQNYCIKTGVIDTITINLFPTIKQIILVGFQQLAPLYKKIFAELQQKNYQIEFYNPNYLEGTQQQIAFPNQQQELIAMATWAKEQLQKNPQAEIGCVIPNLTAIRSEVNYQFQKLLTDNYDISAGKSFSDYPIICDALEILEGGQNLTNCHNSNVWAEIFRNILSESGWLRKCQILAQEQQLLPRWEQLLTEFASLSRVAKPMHYLEAVQLLRGMADRLQFQPKFADKPIKVLGLLEAAGLNFDRLWIMGTTSRVWPPAPQPNPFLPLQLQRQLQMPHATAAKELAYYQELTTNFNHSALEVIYSYPTHDGDTTLLPSALIAQLASGEYPCEDLGYQAENIELERVVDEMAPAVTAAEEIRGGTTIFKLQAQCPFRAFAECRLHAIRSAPEQIGLSPAERGSLLHAVLENFWKTVQSQQQLLGYSSDSLQHVVNASINSALCKYQLPPKFSSLEQQRLRNILWGWLEFEKQRPPFRIVTQEQWQSFNINNIAIHIRPDRIDRLANGALLIIDYKTKHVSKRLWEGERPEEPQLPLYAIANTLPIAGVSFAQVIPGAMKFVGCSEAGISIEGVTTIAEWHEQIKNWQTVLQELADEFCTGFAKVDPKELNTSCRYCELASLCRIAEHNHG